MFRLKPAFIALALLVASLGGFLPAAVQAAPADATYVIDGGNCVPFVPTAQCTANIHIDYNFLGGIQGELVSQFNYKDGSKFDFVNTNDSTYKIHVNFADPGHGQATIKGKTKTITIDQTGNFTGFFIGGKPPESSSTALIKVAATIDFGKTDANLQTGTVEGAIRYVLKRILLFIKTIRFAPISRKLPAKLKRLA
jgi:hypothetical protein